MFLPSCFSRKFASKRNRKDYIIIIRKGAINNSYEKLENELIEMKESEEDLTNEIDRLKDPDYLARYARENYSYSKDGEYIIKIDEDEKKEETSENISYKKYTMYIGISIIGIILIYIIRKGSRKKNKKH